MKKYCWIFLMLTSYLCQSQSNSNSEKNDIGKIFKKDGVCYSKYLKHEYEAKEETYPIFTGTKKKRGVKIKRKTIILKEGTKGTWEKRKADKNCLSSDPNDCMVWCLVGAIPDETATFAYVKNTDKTTEWEMQTFTIYKKIDSIEDEVEVVCSARVTDELLYEIQSKLIDLNYLQKPKVKTKINLLKKVKEALVHFQHNNNLPVGNFDVQTLAKLGINSNFYH